MAGLSYSTEISEQLFGMIEWLEQHPHPNDFVFHLIELLGATLAGVKPAEILTLTVYKDKAKNSDWEKTHSCLSRHKKLKLKDIRFIRDNRQILFYHISALERTLERPVNLRFLRKLGYPENYSLEGYLEHLRKRFKEISFPHEIGIFLGYPLKDVMGFIGHPSLKFIKTRAWKVYGDARLSDKRYQDFREARAEVLRIISETMEKEAVLH
ncbi:MAG: DUF3793 family protein [Desulfitobacteriaceae bacterium]|nr:DUF3793 family protein [Desulfitobacteriaceae bacterium]MDD4346556.1 DUF3793 family protein [Desulfitobacteriaceae bacterium]MDD4401922.1 DUF3793 family protein [Desulfitobacteriaceae bacterium]